MIYKSQTERALRESIYQYKAETYTNLPIAAAMDFQQ